MVERNVTTYDIQNRDKENPTIERKIAEKFLVTAQRATHS